MVCYSSEVWISNYKARKLAEQERAQFVKDSIARVEFVRDSIALENKRAQEARERRAQFVRDSIRNAENQKTIARCSKHFKVREDEFNSIKYYFTQVFNASMFAWYHYAIAVVWFIAVFWLCFRSPIYWGLGKKDGYPFSEQAAFGLFEH